MESRLLISENLCNMTIKVFCAMSKMRRAKGSNVHARFAAWRSSAMAINISALEKRSATSWGAAIVERNR